MENWYFFHLIHWWKSAQSKRAWIFNFLWIFLIIFLQASSSYSCEFSIFLSIFFFICSKYSKSSTLKKNIKEISSRRRMLNVILPRKYRDSMEWISELLQFLYIFLLDENSIFFFPSSLNLKERKSSIMFDFNDVVFSVNIEHMTDLVQFSRCFFLLFLRKNAQSNFSNWIKYN